MSSTTYSPPHDGHHLHPPALHLLDEYWFFSNTLAKPPLPRSSPAPAPNSTTSISTTANKDRGRAHEGGDPGGRRRSCRLLLRTPSLPSPHIDIGIDANHHQQQADEVQVEDDDLNWSSIYEGVLRASKAQGSSSGSSASASRRSSALRRAPSMPSSDNNKYSSCREEPEQEQRRRRHHHHRLLARSRSSSVFQSSSDLESIEVQGFRDLGFVFDKEELRESLAAVLPGLKLKPPPTGGDTSRRPYLSEAWQLVRVQQQSSSIKDQLRMWAQAVASNVRQDHC